MDSELEMSDDNQVRRYLLGDLSSDDQAMFEQRYFGDPNAFENLVAAENDLVDSFSRGELMESERLQFERHYCNSPERRERVEFSKALAQVAKSEKKMIVANKISLQESFLGFFETLNASLQLASIAVAVLVIVGIVGLILQDYRLRGGLQQARTDQEQLRQKEDGLREQISELEQHDQQITGREEGNQVAQLAPPPDLTFNLSPGTERSSIAGQKDFVIPPSPRIRLEMPLYRDDYRSYEAVLLNAELRVVLRGKGLKSRPVQAGKTITWRLPPNSIESGDYVVQLSGMMEDGSTAKVQFYSFRITRK